MVLSTPRQCNLFTSQRNKALCYHCRMPFTNLTKIKKVQPTSTMTEYSDDPFTMDEELPLNKVISSPNIPLYDLPPSKVDDDKLMRSRLARFRLEEANVSTTEEESEKVDEEIKYDEDLDDKLDMKLQQELTLEYKKNHIFGNGSDPITPPENFSTVANNIYRSSFPQPQNFSFLKKLKLKSILCLMPELYPELQQEFLQHENIKLFQLGMSGNKEPFVNISSSLITEAVKIVLDPKNQPILIHCNRGKHRTGCLVGVLRRLQNWSLTILFDEYRKFAAPKERPMDLQFIELYDETEVVKFAEENDLLPITWD